MREATEKPPPLQAGAGRAAGRRQPVGGGNGRWQPGGGARPSAACGRYICDWPSARTPRRPQMCSWCAATGGPSLLRRPGRGVPRASSMWCPSPLIGRAPAALQRPQPRSSPSRPGPSVHGCLPLPSCSPPTGAPIAATSERQAPGCLLPEAVCKTRTLLGQQMNVKDDSTSFSAVRRGPGLPRHAGGGGSLAPRAARCTSAPQLTKLTLQHARQALYTILPRVLTTGDAGGGKDGSPAPMLDNGGRWGRCEPRLGLRACAAAAGASRASCDRYEAT